MERAGPSPPAREANIAQIASLPPPKVPPQVYDERYYLESCAGYAPWRASGGVEIAGIYPGVLAKARMRPGEVVVDIGAGRGELIRCAAEQGAAEAIGIEYSDDAMRLAERTLDSPGTERARMLLADARSLPLGDAFADLVTMVDVVEHLTPDELSQTLREARRILCAGGRLLVHTAPNRTVYEVTYRLQRLATPARRRRWPADPRNEHEHLMHVNEQTPRSLRRALRREGFDPVHIELGDWIHSDFVPDERAQRLYPRLARFRPTRGLAVMDLWGFASR